MDLEEEAVSAVTLSFVVDGKPQCKQRARRGKSRSQGGKGGRWYTPRETVVYENTISAAALAAMAVAGIGRRYPGWVSASVHCYFPDAHRRDVDNVLKAVLDGMKDVVYADDYQVRGATVTKAIDRERPRTEVEVTYG